MNIVFGITHVTRDRRNKAQLESARVIEQERLDQEIEREWRRRVQANITRRRDRRIAEFTGTPLIHSGNHVEKAANG